MKSLRDRLSPACFISPAISWYGARSDT